MACISAQDPPRPPPTLGQHHLRCHCPSSGDVRKPLSTNGKLPFRLAILPNSGSRRSQLERTSMSRDNGTRFISRAARGSSHTRPSSGDAGKPLSSYGQLPFRSRRFFGVFMNIFCVTMTIHPIATCMLQLLTELC
ncbi:hypothetical protein DPMN_052718 [Dreissena polymorpha]|uniref:Uncharacterized protein n=1 Tax=Dreissena polymorpha TaxID=45954 RepID=A0A9D4CMG7_DREPO|nr:hypothetical protein DPMN_052718 [Dreissena polymorpha]